MAAELPPHVSYPYYVERFAELEALYAPPFVPDTILIGPSLCAAWPEADWKARWPNGANLGIGGAKVQDIFKQFQDTQITLTGVGLVIMVDTGYNNLSTTTGDSPGAVESMLRQLIKLIKSKAPTATFIQPDQAPYRPTPRYVFNERLQETSANTGKFVTCACGLPDDAYDDPDLYMDDGIHRKPAAYPLLGEAVEARIALLNSQTG